MAETDTKSTEDGIKATVDSLEAKLREQLAASDTRAAETREQLARVNGQLELLTNAALADANAANKPGKLEAQQLLEDPETTLARFVDQRNAPLIRQQQELNAQNQREIAQLKNGEDWKRFGPAVDKLIADAKLDAATLAAPGSYERLLNVVKAQNLDALVKERVEKEVAEATAKLQETAARSAGSGVGSAGKEPAPAEVKVEQLDDFQKHIARKLGVSDEKYAKAATANTYDGVRYRGEVPA